jgi:hypothetical protein
MNSLKNIFSFKKNSFFSVFSAKNRTPQPSLNYEQMVENFHKKIKKDLSN